MEGGDITDRVAPRILVIGEGTLLTVPPRADRKRASWRWFRNHRRLAGAYEVQPHARAFLHDCVWRLDQRVDLVLFEDPKVGEILQERLDADNLVVRVVTYPTPGHLARALAYMPEVARIWFGDPALQFTFGGRGEYAPGLAGISL